MRIRGPILSDKDKARYKSLLPISLSSGLAREGFHQSIYSTNDGGLIVRMTPNFNACSCPSLHRIGMPFVKVAFESMSIIPINGNVIGAQIQAGCVAFAEAVKPYESPVAGVMHDPSQT